MEHPLIGSIDSLSTDQLLNQINDLHQKLTIAHRIGNYYLCEQIRMAIETYQNKYSEKLRSGGKDTFNDIIDIK